MCTFAILIKVIIDLKLQIVALFCGTWTSTSWKWHWLDLCRSSVHGAHPGENQDRSAKASSVYSSNVALRNANW